MTGLGGGDDDLFDDVLELADVAGPFVAGKAREGFARERLDRAFAAPGAA